MIDDDIGEWKSFAIKSIFINTADHNYIVARWAFFHGLYRDFYWNALHCVEKYLKAGLVLNGFQVAEESHNILGMFKKIEYMAGEFLPPSYEFPHETGVSSFFKENCLNEFVNRLNSFGHPDNRYAYFGYGLVPDEIGYLDALVFLIRRVCVTLDRVVGQSDEEPALTFREKLRLDPMYQPCGIYPQLPKLEDIARIEELKEALFRLNCAFLGPKEYRVGKLPALRLENSVLDLLREGSGSLEKTHHNIVRAEVIRWLIENIKFGGEIKRLLQRVAQEHVSVND